MPIYQTAYYQVKPEAINDCKKAIEIFLDYIKANEPGTEMYLAWQQKSDPTSFVHLFRFKDKQAHETHGASAAVKKFESVYRPVLVSDGVTFTDYKLVAGKNTVLI
jgi:quinol monooxygenase YgiN